MDPDYTDGHGAESLNAMAQRMRVVLADLARLEPGYHIAINHGLTMQTMWVMLTHPTLTSRELMRTVRACQNQQPVPNVGKLSLVSEQGRLRLLSDWKQPAMCA